MSRFEGSGAAPAACQNPPMLKIEDTDRVRVLTLDRPDAAEDETEQP